MKIKLIVLLFLTICNHTVFSQQSAKVYQPEMLYFYSSYDNILNWTNFDNCDSTVVVVNGAYFEKTSENSGIVKVGRGTILTKVYLNGYFGNKIIVKDSIEVEAGPIPTPQIYIKTENPIWKNIEHIGIGEFNSEVIKYWTGFYVTKNRFCPIDFKCDIGNWNIIVDGKDYYGVGKEFTTDLITALQNLKSGDKVMLYSVTVLIPDSRYIGVFKLKSEITID
jgi:hypothetical protein